MMAATGSLKMTAWAPDSWKEKVAGVEINEGLVGIVNLPPLVRMRREKGMGKGMTLFLVKVLKNTVGNGLGLCR